MFIKRLVTLYLLNIVSNIVSNIVRNKRITKKSMFTLSSGEYIPKIVHCTYYDLEKIPKHVILNLQNKTKGYQLNIYNDNDCKNIIKKINPTFPQLFEQLKSGAHKADLFRYCVLYLYGGIYLDIKSNLVKNLSEIIDHSKQKTLYTVLMLNRPKEHFEFKFIRKIRMSLDISNGKIYQGFIATYPGNKIFIDLINHFEQSIPPPNYHFTVSRFYDLIRLQTKYRLHEGKQLTKDYGTIILFTEINKEISKNEKPDYMGCFYKIFYKNKLFLHTRYNDFPW